ncbi:MAG: hypothetical protein KH828_11265 [Clostridiales bacterium]|nr:hypothetical protein [Clostridiales bacterium]
MAKEGVTDILENIYPYMFRCSRSSKLYRDGVPKYEVPLEIIAAVLDHANMKITKIYAVLFQFHEQIKETLKKGMEREAEKKLFP